MRRAAFALAYAAFLRFLAGCFPMCWDLQSVRAYHESIHRSTVWK